MKKILSIGMLSVLSLNIAACNNDKLITKTYKVETVNAEGYTAKASNNEGIFFTKNDINFDLHKGNKIKVYFTKKQYENMEGLEKVEFIK